MSRLRLSDLFSVHSELHRNPAVIEYISNSKRSLCTGVINVPTSTPQLCIPLQRLPVKTTGPAFKAMLFQLTLEKSQTTRDEHSEAICYIDVSARITLNP